MGHVGQNGEDCQSEAPRVARWLRLGAQVLSWLRVEVGQRFHCARREGKVCKHTDSQAGADGCVGGQMKEFRCQSHCDT